MAILKKTSFDERLETINVLVKDTEPNSRYFKITELPDTFSGGKNSFLIQGSPELVSDTVVKIQIRDSQGNIIYTEPGEGIPEYYEGTSKVVAVYVYPDTSFGPCTITILGELNEYISNGFRTPIPDNWKDTYNVKWEKQINVNPFLANTSKIRFYRRPKITISESVLPIYNRVVNRVSVSGSINGTPFSPNQFEDYRTFKGITRYELSLNGLSQFSESMEREIIEINGLEKSYTPIITDVTSNKKAFVDIPYYVTASTTQNYYSVTPFTSASFTMSYDENISLSNSSINTSFAKINITDLETFSGDVNRIKVYASSKNDLGDFQLLEDIQLESNELLITASFDNQLNVRTGLFTPSIILSNFWITSSIESNVNISTDNSILLKSVVLTPETDASSSVGLFKFYNSELINFTKNTEYQLDYTPLLISAAQTFGGIDIYMSGSAFVTDSLTNGYGKQIGKLTSNSQFKKYDKQQINFKPDNDGNGVLVFIIKGGTWHIADVSLRAAQESSFSPNEITLTANVPVKINNETFDFKFELYDINNTFVPVLLEKTFTFTGGNDVAVRRDLQLNVSNTSFNFSTGSSFPSQITIDFTKLGLTGSVSFSSQSVDINGNKINGTPQPGTLQYVDVDTRTLSLADFTGSSLLAATVGAINYTASCEDINRYFTIFRIEQGAPARLFYATADKNTFVFDPDDRYKSVIDNDYIDIRLVRQNLPAFESEGYNITSGSEVGIPPPLYEIESVGNATVYRLYATSSTHQSYPNGNGYYYDLGQSHYDFKYDTVDGDFTSSVTIDAVLKGDKGKGLIATSDRNQFFYKMTDLTPTPSSQTATILVKRQNLGSLITPTPITYTKSGGTGPNLTLVSQNIGNGVAQFTMDTTAYTYGMGETKYTFQATDLNGVIYYDEISLAALIAESQISVNLTNENATLPARSTGFIPTTSFTLTSGSVSVKVGGDDIIREEGLATNNRFDIISATGIGCTPNDTTPDDATYGITSLTADSGSLNLVVRYKDGRGVTTDVSKSVTYSKAKTAAPSVSISTTNKAQSVSAKSTGGQIDSFANAVVTVTQTYNNSISNLTLTSLTATSSDLESIVTNNSTGVITLAGRTLVDETNATSITVTAVVTDSEGQSRTLTDTISLTKVKKAAPVLAISSTPKDQSVTAKSTGEQIDSFANATIVVKETYNGATSNLTITGLTATSANISSISTTPSTGLVTLNGKILATGINSTTVAVTAVVTDSEGVSRTLTDTLSLSKVKKAVPNVAIAVSPSAQTLSANSRGSGSSVPNPLTITALEGNINSFSSIGNPTYTNGLTGSINSNSNILTFRSNATSMSSDTGQITIPVNYIDSEGTSGTKDIIATVSKVRTSAPNTVVSLSSETQTISSGSAGYGPPQPITVTVSEGAGYYTYDDAGDLANSTFRISVTSAANNFDGTFTPEEPATDNGITVLVAVTYKNSEGSIGQIDKTHTVSVLTGTPISGSDGSNAVNIAITPASQTVTRTISGIYSAPIPIVVSVTEGGITAPYTYSDGLATIKTFKITSINQTNPTGNPTNNLNGTITLLTPTAIAGSVVSFNVTYKDSKGTTVSNIPQSHSINVALDGSTGPGIVFTGEWDTLRAYQYDISNGRRDAVLYNDIYYATLQPTTAATDPPNVATAFWQSLGSEDFFVAAKIAIFEESFVKNTLNIGTNVNDGISSANITLSGGTIYPYFSLGQSTAGVYNADGIFIGAVNDSGTKYKMSLKSATNSLLWDGSGLTINGSGTFTGTVTATAGAIGGWSISSTELAGGSPSGGGDGSFTSSGIRLGSSGYISSKNFYINSSGAAVFKGDITGASGTFGGATIDGNGITFGNFRLGITGINFVSYNYNSEVQDYSMFCKRLRLYRNDSQFGPQQGSYEDVSLQFDHLDAVTTGTVSLQVDGGGNVYKAGSTRRIKKNIEDTTLDKAKRILNLNVRSFNGLRQNNGDEKAIGFIAEEVYDLGYNDLVVMGQSGSIDSVEYQSVFSSMVKVVQDLNSRIEQLEARLSGSI